MVLVWLSVWSEMQMICIWSSWCHCHPVISCCIKIQIDLIFLVPAYRSCPGKEAVERVSVCMSYYQLVLGGSAGVKGAVRLPSEEFCGGWSEDEVRLLATGWGVSWWMKWGWGQTPGHWLRSFVVDEVRMRSDSWPLVGVNALTLLFGLQEEHLACKSPMPLLPKGYVVDKWRNKTWRPADPGSPGKMLLKLLPLQELV